MRAGGLRWCEWLAALPQPAAWLSLDEGDGDPARFLAYLVAALRTVAADIGEGVLDGLESPQPPPMESILTALLNEIDAMEDAVVLVLDDYHVIDAGAVDEALAFMLEHLPPRIHLVVEVLLARLTQERPARIPTLHRRASEWYEQNGLPAEAIRHIGLAWCHGPWPCSGSSAVP
jgi:ATP/maltotriose-dependent transcriptional regulator MalT